MSVLPQKGVRATSIFTLSSSMGTMPPTTHEVASKEALEATIKEEVEVTKPTIPIYKNT